MSEFEKHWVKREWQKLAKDKVHVEAAKALGAFIADGIEKGLTKDVAFEAARQHFLTYGQAMVDVANVIKIDWIDSFKGPKK